MYIGKINISLKKSVLDPQGSTILKALHDMGENNIADLRIGKYVEVKLNLESEEKAKETLDRICNNLLVNKVIEIYDIKLEKVN